MLCVQPSHRVIPMGHMRRLIEFPAGAAEVDMIGGIARVLPSHLPSWTKTTRVHRSKVFFFLTGCTGRLLAEHFFQCVCVRFVVFCANVVSDGLQSDFVLPCEVFDMFTVMCLVTVARQTDAKTLLGCSFRC